MTHTIAKTKLAPASLSSLAAALLLAHPIFADELDNAAEQTATSNRIYIIGIALLVVAVVVFLIVNRSALSRHSDNASKSPLDEDKVSDAIRLSDPDFKRDELKKYADEALLAVLNAHSRRDAAMLRPYETDALYAIHSRTIRELAEGGRTNHFDDVKTVSTELAEFDGSAENERLTVRATVNLLDYTCEDSSGTVLEGSKLARLNRAYKLVFVRPRGTKSDAGAWKLDEMLKWKKA